jgi:hypothetical protein
MKLKYFDYGPIAEQKAYQDTKGNWIHYVRHSGDFGSPGNHVSSQSSVLTTYSKWLMTDEERKIYDQYDYDTEGYSENNKLADGSLMRVRKAYEKGQKDRVDGLPYEFDDKSKYSLENVYRAAYEGMIIEEILDRKITYKRVIFVCPWHSPETIEYYKKDPWVTLIDYQYPAGFISRKQAVELRGSPEKFQEYIDLINSQQAPHYPEVYCG